MILGKTLVWEYSGMLQNMHTYAEFLVEIEILSVNTTVLKNKVIYL